jgi:hypothetical protein
MFVGLTFLIDKLLGNEPIKRKCLKMEEMEGRRADRGFKCRKGWGEQGERLGLESMSHLPVKCWMDS